MDSLRSLSRNLPMPKWHSDRQGPGKGMEYYEDIRRRILSVTSMDTLKACLDRYRKRNSNIASPRILPEVCTAVTDVENKSDNYGAEHTTNVGTDTVVPSHGAVKTYNPLTDDTLSYTADNILQALTDKIFYRVSVNTEALTAVEEQFHNDKLRQKNAVNYLRSLKDYHLDDPCASARLCEAIDACDNMMRGVDTYHGSMQRYMRLHPAIEEAIKANIVSETAKRQFNNELSAKLRIQEAAKNVIKTARDGANLLTEFLDLITKYNATLLNGYSMWQNKAKRILLYGSYNPDNDTKLVALKAQLYKLCPTRGLKSLQKVLSLEYVWRLLPMPVFTKNLATVVCNRALVKEADEALAKGNLKRWHKQTKKATQSCKLTGDQQEQINKSCQDIIAKKKSLDNLESRKNDCLQKLETLKNECKL